MRNEIILIGPMGVGKSSVSKRLSEKLNKSHINIDEIRFKYYDEIGYDKNTVEQLWKEKGFFNGVYRYWKPFELYAIKKILNEYSDCIFDFGAGHSVYEDDKMFQEVQETLNDFKNVILLLPSANSEESIEILSKIYKPEAENDVEMIDFIRHTIEHHSNNDLAKYIIYGGKIKSIDDLADEIISVISCCP